MLVERINNDRFNMMIDGLSLNPNGGIDLDRANLDLSVQKEGNGVKMNFDPAMAAQIRREGVSGLVPVILNITPVTNILPLLGMTAADAAPVSA